MADPTTSYDEIPYPSIAFPLTHPVRFASVAALGGIDPPDVSRARVLEIGCARGGNLIPMACVLRDATFVGLDLSRRQIDEARATANALGLANVELRHADIMDVDERWGTFDYVIAHGVYSWVPPPVRDKLLSICSRNLSPRGVAFVSYNTYPGWNHRRIVRQLMQWHTRDVRDPAERVREARAILEFVANNAPPGEPYGQAMRRELELIDGGDDGYVFHEFLEETNEPVHFHEFAAHAARHGLQYLGESEFGQMVVSNFPAPAAQTLTALASSIVELEQYMDFLRNRLFRQTLLVHEGIEIRRRLDWRSLQTMHVRGTLRPESPEPSLAQGVPVKFVGPTGAAITSPHALTKAALIELTARHPLTVPFAELVAAARARVDAQPGLVHQPAPAGDADLVGIGLLNAYSADLVEIRVLPIAYPVVPSERPRATALARLQAAGPGPVVSVQHRNGDLNRLSRELLVRLDGTRTSGQLVDEIAALVAGGGLALVGSEGGASAHPSIVGRAVDETLRALARDGYLEA